MEKVNRSENRFALLFVILFSLSSITFGAQSFTIDKLNEADFNKIEMGAACWLEKNGQIYAYATGGSNLYISSNGILLKLLSTSESNIFYKSDLPLPRKSYYVIPGSEMSFTVTEEFGGVYSIEHEHKILVNLKHRCGA